MDIEEFWLIWFETSRQWVLVFPDGTTFSNNWGAVGYAFQRALALIDRSEAEFECDEDSGSCQHWVKDEEFWDAR